MTLSIEVLLEVIYEEEKFPRDRSLRNTYVIISLLDKVVFASKKTDSSSLSIELVSSLSLDDAIDIIHLFVIKT
jgi:hypothetical protein